MPEYRHTAHQVPFHERDDQNIVKGAKTGAADPEDAKWHPQKDPEHVDTRVQRSSSDSRQVQCCRSRADDRRA